MTAGPGELLAEVAEAVRASQSATISSLDPEATLWLAAAPAWTAAVAADARFPVTSLAWWVDQACRAGLCKVRGDQDEPDRLFWMPDEVRRDLVGVLLDRIGKSQVNEVLARIALRASVASARLPDDQVPGALREWAGLMASLMESGPPVAAQLVERVQQAVAERDLARAQDLVTAGEPIACLLGGSAEQALSRSRRLLALGRQRRQDERALVRYLDRSELSAAVRRLLERRPPASARPGPWAMHLRGVGGVGKTMLIRYLASGEYARDRGVAPFPLARADFDHISPDYRSAARSSCYWSWPMSWRCTPPGTRRRTGRWRRSVPARRGPTRRSAACGRRAARHCRPRRWPAPSTTSEPCCPSWMTCC